MTKKLKIRSEADAPDVHVAETKVRVSRTVKIDGEEAMSMTDETIEVHQFATTPAQAHVSVPVKIAKNYNSSGITVGVTVPCYAEELPAAIDKAYSLATKKVQEQVPGIVEALNNLG